MRRRWAWWGAAVLLVGSGLAVLVAATGDVERSSAVAGGVPVRIVSATADDRAPAVVLAHGFAGSAAMMDPLASALARAGFLVVLPELPGHGANPAPLADGSLEPAIGSAVGLARERTSGTTSVAGHSMGAGAVTSWASAAGSDPEATIAISLPSAEDLPAEPARPANLLLLWGSAEQQRFVDAALEALRLGYPDAVPGRSYGDPAAGTARRAVEIAGAEHIGVVYRDQTAQEIARWVHGGPQGQPSGDPRWIGLVLVLLGGLLATRPILAGRPVAEGEVAEGEVAEGLGDVPTVARPRVAPFLVWAGMAAVGGGIAGALVGAFADLVPVAVAGYLIAWFAAGAAVLAAGAGRRMAPAGSAAGLVRGTVAGAVLALALALPARLTWAAFDIVGPRWWVLLLLLVVLGAWFHAEQRMVARARPVGRALALAASRVIVVVGLLAAVLLLGAPGFLTLTVPLVIPILALLGVVAWWTLDPAAAASAQAIPLALTIATTFPIVG